MVKDNNWPARAEANDLLFQDAVGIEIAEELGELLFLALRVYMVVLVNPLSAPDAADFWRMLFLLRARSETQKAPWNRITQRNKNNTIKSELLNHNDSYIYHTAYKSSSVLRQYKW